jgi:hypothetical protein
VPGSYLDGWARALRAPAVVAGVLATALLFTLPFFTGVADRGDAAAEFAARVEYVGDTITYETLAFAGTFRRLTDLLGPKDLPPWIAGPTAGCLLVWLFLSGGALDRLARNRPIRTAAFFAAAGVYFFRFLRLGLLTGAAYWALLHAASDWLDDPVYGSVLAAAAAIVLVVSDFARVRLVVEDRRSVVGALLASLRFVRRRPLRIAGLFALHAVALVLVAYAWSIRPELASGAPLLAAGGLYLGLRVVARLAFMAAQVSFFQAELAHATYTAAPLPVWPDSPAVEAIDNFLRQRDR